MSEIILLENGVELIFDDIFNYLEVEKCQI